jgi:hypothetical protein
MPVGPVDNNGIWIALPPADGDGNAVSSPTQILDTTFDDSVAYFKIISDARRRHKAMQYQNLIDDPLINKQAAVGTADAINNRSLNNTLVRSLIDATQKLYIGHTEDLYDVRDATTELNDAMNDYNPAAAIYQAILDSGRIPTPTEALAFVAAQNAFKAAIDKYNTDPDVIAAKTAQANYSQIAEAYNANVDLLKNNSAIYNQMRVAAGLPPLSNAFFNQLSYASLTNPDPVIIDVYPVPSDYPPFEQLNYLPQPLSQPINTTGAVPNPFTEEQAKDALAAFPADSTDEMIAALESYQNKKDSDLLYYGGEIDIPTTYIDQYSSYLANAAAAVGAETNTGLMVLSLSNVNLTPILNRLSYQEVINQLNLEAFPQLTDHLETLALNLIGKAAEYAARNSNLQALVKKSGVPEGQDPLFDVESSLAFASVIRDLILSGGVKTAITQLINNDPNSSALSATAKLELATALSAVLHITIQEVALTEIAQALKSPGLTPQVLANIPSYPSPLVSGGNIPRVPNFKRVFSNPLSQVFLQINLIKAATASLAQSSAGATPQDVTTLSQGIKSASEMVSGKSESLAQSPAGATPQDVTNLSQGIKSAIEMVSSKSESLDSEADLKAALNDAFAQNGLTGASDLTNTALALIKSEGELTALDQRFNSGMLSLILPLINSTGEAGFTSAATKALTSQVPDAPASDPTFTSKALVALTQTSPIGLAAPLSATTQGQSISAPRAPLASTLSTLLTDLAPQLFNPITVEQAPSIARKAPLTAKDVIGTAINTVLKDGSFRTPETFRAALESALTTPNLGSIPRVPLSRSVARRVTEAALDYVNALAVPVEGNPTIRPNERVLIDRLSNILLESLPENHTLNTLGDKKQAAEALAAQGLNMALASEGILSNAAAAASGLVRIFIQLGIPRDVAISMASETADFINSDIRSSSTGLPTYLNTVLPVGTRTRDLALGLVATGLENDAIGTALTKTLSNSATLTSNRAFYSQYIDELRNTGLSSAEAIDVATRTTKFLEREPPDPAERPLIAVGLNARVLNKPELSEAVSGTVLELLADSANADFYRAREYLGLVNRSLLNLSSGINEQLIILKDEDHTNAIRALNKKAQELGPDNLSLFALHTFVDYRIKTTAEKTASYMDPVRQQDLRTSDMNQQSDKNIKI